MNTLLTDPFVPHHYELDGVVATIDGQHGLRGEESVKQAAAADVLVLTKPDLADGASLDALEAELASLNPTAPTVLASFGDVDPELLLRARRPRPLRELTSSPTRHTTTTTRSGPSCSTLDERVDWTAFGIWLTMLLHARGSDLYRVKGLLDVGGEGPLLVNGVQHAVHPPVHLDTWPDDERRSRLVVIGRGVEREQLARRCALRPRGARLAGRRDRDRKSMGSVKGEQWWEDHHDRCCPEGEDGKVGRLPSLEPMQRAASGEESSG